MDHAFKGTRFPWTRERMEFILNELITKHKKYKTYTKLIEVYIILAEKIGATPRIVENFIKNLGRDYREWMKMHPDCDRDSIKLRGSNKIFKLFEEYNRIYLHEDPPIYPPPKLSEYTLDEQDRLVQIPEGGDDDDDDDDDIPQYLEVIEVDSGVKEEPGDVHIMSVMSMSSQATCSNADDEPPSPTPPPPPLPRVPKLQGRRSTIGSMQAQASSSASVLRQQEPIGLQDVVSIPTDMAQLKHVTPRSSGPSSTLIQGHVQSHVPTLVPTNVHTSVATQGLLSTISSLPSLVQHPPFHLPPGTASSPGIGSHYIPLHVIQNGPAPTTAFTASSSIALEDIPSSIPGTSNKRPMKAQHDTQQQHSSKRSRTSSVPLVAENLPDGMTEFERRYLQGMDTQNKMLSDIGRELKLLRTGFYAIHSDEIADMVNPNMH